MSETPAEPTPPAEPAAQPPGPEPAADEPADSTDWKAEARKWETRAKENGAAAKELEKQRQASMTEAEKAVAEAETRGRTAASQDFGKRLARTQFDALAGRRNPDVSTDDVLEYVDLGRFVGEDGEPDSKAIASAVERLVPAASGAAPTVNLDLGQRTTPTTSPGMSQIIRKAAGRA